MAYIEDSKNISSIADYRIFSNEIFKPNLVLLSFGASRRSAALAHLSPSYWDPVMPAHATY